MKHQYFGDVNDYVKYGLLRCFADAGFRVGVLWMLTPEDGRPDGRKTKYLSRPEKWKHHDPGLFALLSNTLSGANGKHIRHIQAKGIIPHGRFSGSPVPDARTERIAWYENATLALRGTDFLFFDPDNGIEVPSKPMGRKDSSKFIYWEELQRAWTQNSSLLVFQHFPREKRNVYIPAMVAEMQKRMQGAHILPLKASNVLFLLAYRVVDRPRVSKAIRLIENRWSSRVSEYTAT
jgi:hypothetical protein